MKPRIISGIKPSGRLHLGNYLGALKHFVELQDSNDYDCFFFIADLHSLAEDFDPKEKPAQIADLAVSFLAAGLDPQKSTLFIQSLIPEHSELAWILSTQTPMGELARMTQYKDKSESGGANAGLFTYPVLMAADILLYGAAEVPVGEDQDQHLELTRTLARKFNARFGNTFIEPKGKKTETPRIMSLDDPAKKMAKSRPAGCIFLDDEPVAIQEKLMAAVTDSGSQIAFDEAAKPGISNLLRIASALSGESIENLVSRYRGAGYAAFKKEVGALIANHFTPFRAHKAKLAEHSDKALAVFAKGSKAAQKIAAATTKTVRERVGLV